MLSILDILGVLSEQTRFYITVHRFSDPLILLEYCSDLLKPQDLDKVLYYINDFFGISIRFAHSLPIKLIA
jgi:hypothetical protein